MVEHNSKSNSRILIEANLKPIQGNRFQPTGFPDVGAAEYQLANGTHSLIVDSPQAVVNHLEKHSLNSTEENFVEALRGLSIVHVKDKNGGYLTNTVREGHRLNSPYVLGGKNNRTKVGKEFDKLDTKTKQLANREKIIDTIFRYDVNSLLHGVWFSQVGEGRIRFARALSAFVEADNAKTVVYGGVKRDHITTSTKKNKDNNNDEIEVEDSAAGYGSIPFHSIEYTAEKITVFFNLDLGQIYSYRLGSVRTELLKTLALWKIRKFLDSPFRPRTSCDLVRAGDFKITEPAGFDLPSITDLDKSMKNLISECKDTMDETEVTT